MVSLDQTKQDFRNLITGELTRAFEEIKAQVPGKTKKFDTFLLLQGRYTELLKKVQRGVISSEEQRLETNRIREQLLVWIDGLEEKDLEAGDSSLKKKRRLPLILLGAILFVAIIVWGLSFMTPFGSMEKEELPGIDTTSMKVVSSPDSTSKVINNTEPIEKKQEEKKAVLDQAIEKTADKPIEAVTIEIQIMVDALWKDSEIRVNGKAVEPLKRLGTLIFLTLPIGSHELELISREHRCTKRVLVREEGQRIPITCD